MKIVIPGGAGHLGLILADYFVKQGHEVVLFSRKANSSPFTSREWDGQTQGSWSKEIDGADVVINLAGRSVNCRYNPENRRQITESRVLSTRAVGEAIASAKNPPPLWLQMSTATIYAHRFDAANDETHGIIGGAEPDAPDTWRFSIDVVKAWEKAFDEAPVPSSTRRVKLRTSIVLSPYRGGAFRVLLNLVRLGLGGKAGNGLQYMSWITDTDFARAIQFIIEHAELEGPVNIASPRPLPNHEFMKILRQAWGSPFGLPATEWMLELGAIPLQTETELVLKSRRVVPGKLIDSGFTFNFPDWAAAANHLCARVRAAG